MARLNNKYYSPYEATVARYFPRLDRWLYPAEAGLLDSTKTTRHFSTRNIVLEKPVAKVAKKGIDSDLLSYAADWVDAQSIFPRKIIAGGFTPLAYMVKDLKDTFKPYKADYQRKRDWMQPIYGFANILRGVFSLPLAAITLIVYVVYLAWQVIKLPYRLYNRPRRITEQGGLGIALWTANTLIDILILSPIVIASDLIAHVLDCVFSITRGLTQIATSPLTWFIKIPLRHFGLTQKDEMTTDRVQQKVEDNAGVKKMYQLLKSIEANTAPPNYSVGYFSDQPRHLNEACNMFKFKVLKALRKGQPTATLSDIENQVINNGRDNSSDFMEYAKGAMEPKG